MESFGEIGDAGAPSEALKDLKPLSRWLGLTSTALGVGVRSEKAGLSQDRKGVAESRGFLRKNSPDPQTLTTLAGTLNGDTVAANGAGNEAARLGDSG